MLLDEPLSNLDAKLRITMRGEIKRLQKDLGITTIFVTHDQLEAMTMSDRIALMKDGKLVAYSPPHELYDHPRTVFAAEFIGSTPMNFMRVRADEQDGRVALATSNMVLPLEGSLARKVKALGAGYEMILGIRPEDVSLETQTPDVQAEVYVSEPLGRDQLFDLRIGTTPIRALAPSTFSAGIGATVPLAFNRAKIHLFDAKTEQSLLD